MSEIILPVKCSTVRSLDRFLNRLNLNLFWIACCVSTLWFVLAWLGIIPIHRYVLMGMLYLITGFLGTTICIIFGVPVIVEKFILFVKWFISLIPTLKCIED